MIHGAYILARYSTDRQNPDSIEVQVEKCSKWCTENSIPILDVFADLAVSGMKNTRPQYERMMKQLKAGGADTVVIYDQSRMFRKLTAWFNFRSELENMGVRVVSVTQPMIGGDLQDPTNFLTEGSMALFNQIWALQTRQKVIEKMRFMAANGMHTGGKPALGYGVVENKLVVCEPEAEIVRFIFDEYASGSSYREIISMLNAKGYKTKNGKPFGSNSLHDLLKNPKYIGTLVYGKSKKRPDGRRNNHGAIAEDAIILENAIPPIIDKKTWEVVQKKMSENKKQVAGRPPSKREYPLKGKVFCEKCKNAMTITTSKYKYDYYNCTRKSRLKDCDLSPIRADELEHIVANAVRQTLGNPENVEKLIIILREQKENIQSSAVAQLQHLIKQKNDIAKRLEAAVNAIFSGLNSPTLKEKMEELEAEKAKIEHDMFVLKQSVDATTLSECDLRETLNKIIECAYNDETILLSIVRRVEVGDEKLTIWTMLSDYDDDFGGKEVIINGGVRSPAPKIFITAKAIRIVVDRIKRSIR